MLDGFVTRPSSTKYIDRGIAEERTHRRRTHESSRGIARSQWTIQRRSTLYSRQPTADSSEAYTAARLYIRR